MQRHLTIQPLVIMINFFHQVLYCTLQSVIYNPLEKTLSLSVFLNLIICLIFNHQMPLGGLELGQILKQQSETERLKSIFNKKLKFTILTTLRQFVGNFKLLHCLLLSQLNSWLTEPSETQMYNFN